MAKGGSQLSQLKTALNKAGITGPPESKKRKRIVSQDKDKEKRKSKLEEIHRKLNPFDEKVTKLKHDVGGRKLKGVIGKPAQSKMAGLQQREKTLLKELDERGHAGGIVDRRFGENDPSMSLEERMLQRFTKERQRTSRNSAFNLDDEEELTHYGQSLSKLDDFDNAGLTLDMDEEDDAVDVETAKKINFGGFDDEDEQDEENEDGQPPRKKSKAEIMAEVMAKSKGHKMLRQLQQQQNENLTHELNQDYDSIRHLLHSAPPPPPSPPPPAFAASGSNSQPLGLRPTEPKPSDQQALVPEDVNYDKLVKELAFDKRAKPKDRTKTEEEVALEAKEKLEKAERQRRKRMLGLSDDEDEDGKRQTKRQRGADDLDDDYEVDGDDSAWTGLGPGLEEDDGALDDEDEDEGEGEEEPDIGEEDEEDGYESQDDDDEEEASDGEEGDEEELVRLSKPAKSTPTRQNGSSAQELPFTFPCPTTHDEFWEIVEGLDDVQVGTVVQRIRTLYHTSLAPDNKVKLQVFAGILIDHILFIASPPNSNITRIASILPHLVALTTSYPIESAEHFIEKLCIMHKNLKRGLSRGPVDADAKTWPGLPELSLLRVIGELWPTSDLHHVVISPTRLLIGAYLGLGRVRSLTDIASGLFLCTLFLHFERLSKRFSPEAVNFVVNAVTHLAPLDITESSELPGSFPCPDFHSTLCQPLRVSGKKAVSLEVKPPSLPGLLGGEQATESDKVSLLNLALDLLGRFADMYKGLEGFIELYDPILEIIRHIQAKKLPKAIQTRLTELNESLSRLLKFSRQGRRPLRLQAHKAIAIPTYIPKFESTSSSYLRQHDPDRERAEANKLRRQYKEERKGAIRELRKDAKFLASVQQKRQQDKDLAYNERMRKVHGSIEVERAEQKSMEREKAKEKKRSGRK